MACRLKKTIKSKHLSHKKQENPQNKKTQNHIYIKKNLKQNRFLYKLCFNN